MIAACSGWYAKYTGSDGSFFDPIACWLETEDGYVVGLVAEGVSLVRVDDDKDGDFRVTYIHSPNGIPKDTGVFAVRQIKQI